ncbi:HNH endonuclease [Plantibacter sp. H53]|uniref:HNH endonuclease n=1 Tax=Plantibacter sp. H53 TaxID=1827323 RepID=UPI000B2BB4C2|nr:HNH endonuclease [Plantibacter sp. H53]
MRFLNPPLFGVQSVVAVMEESPEVLLVVANAAALGIAEAAYKARGHAEELYLSPRDLSSIGAAEHDAIKWTYSNRFVPKTKNARMYYEVLRELVDDFDCPYCLRREVDELDHYLPKSKFKYLAVVPLNLVPICSKCNKKKKAFVASTADEQPLHPYFDDLGGFDWLVAVLSETSGALTYEVAPPARWSPTLAARVCAHFGRHDLGPLYSKQASRFLGGLRLSLTRRFDVGGAVAVRKSLVDLERSWLTEGSEPWNVAALRAWSASDWFCAGGFGRLVLAADDLHSASEAIA